MFNPKTKAKEPITAEQRMERLLDEPLFTNMKKVRPSIPVVDVVVTVPPSIPVFEGVDTVRYIWVCMALCGCSIRRVPHALLEKGGPDLVYSFPFPLAAQVNKEWRSKVCSVDGDIQKEMLGLSEQDLNLLAANVTVRTPDPCFLTACVHAYSHTLCCARCHGYGCYCSCGVRLCTCAPASVCCLAWVGHGVLGVGRRALGAVRVSYLGVVLGRGVSAQCGAMWLGGRTCLVGTLSVRLPTLPLPFEFIIYIYIYIYTRFHPDIWCPLLLLDRDSHCCHGQVPREAAGCDAAERVWGAGGHQGRQEAGRVRGVCAYVHGLLAPVR